MLVLAAIDMALFSNIVKAKSQNESFDSVLSHMGIVQAQAQAMAQAQKIKIWSLSYTKIKDNIITWYFNTKKGTL